MSGICDRKNIGHIVLRWCFCCALVGLCDLGSQAAAYEVNNIYEQDMLLCQPTAASPRILRFEFNDHLHLDPFLRIYFRQTCLGFALLTGWMWLTLDH